MVYDSADIDSSVESVIRGLAFGVGKVIELIVFFHWYISYICFSGTKFHYLILYGRIYELLYEKKKFFLYFFSQLGYYTVTVDDLKEFFIFFSLMLESI